MIWRLLCLENYGSFLPLVSCVLRLPIHLSKKTLVFFASMNANVTATSSSSSLSGVIRMLMAARRNLYVFSTLSEMGEVKGEGGGEEFEEEEIWAVVAKLNLKHSGRGESRREMASGNSLRRQPTASRMVPRSKNETEETTAGWRPQSAPVNIPDWSQIQKKEQALRIIQDEEEEKGKEDKLFEKGEMVPPHQLIARQLARSQMTSFSMCEGAGRTLKGRDLSRVRNAVLTRTGFLE